MTALSSSQTLETPIQHLKTQLMTMTSSKGVDKLFYLSLYDAIKNHLGAESAYYFKNGVISLNGQYWVEDNEARSLWKRIFKNREKKY